MGFGGDGFYEFYLASPQWFFDVVLGCVLVGVLIFVPRNSRKNASGGPENDN